jgi:hypothetical protein
MHRLHTCSPAAPAPLCPAPSRAAAAGRQAGCGSHVGSWHVQAGWRGNAAAAADCTEWLDVWQLRRTWTVASSRRAWGARSRSAPQPASAAEQLSQPPLQRQQQHRMRLVETCRYLHAELMGTSQQPSEIGTWTSQWLPAHLQGPAGQLPGAKYSTMEQCLQGGGTQGVQGSDRCAGREAGAGKTARAMLPGAAWRNMSECTAASGSNLQPGAWMYAVMASLPVSRCADASALWWSLDCSSDMAGECTGLAWSADPVAQASRQM